jgi:hypothetical protein
VDFLLKEKVPNTAASEGRMMSGGTTAYINKEMCGNKTKICIM